MYAYLAQGMMSANTGLKLDPHAKLTITKVYDGGRISGIICTVDINGDTLSISLTYLIFSEDHPLKEKIDEYKKNRNAVLKAAHPTPSQHYNNNPKEKQYRSRESNKKCKRCFG